MNGPWDLRWDDEPWVKQFQNSSVEWKALPLQVRALGQLLWGEVDRAGILPLGRLEAARAVAVRLGDAGAADWIRPQLAQLVDAGWCTITDGVLAIPHFLAAQEARQSDKARAKRHRDLQRAMGKPVGPRNAPQEPPAAGAPASHEEEEPGATVTGRDPSVTTRSDQLDQEKDPSRASAPAGAGARGRTRTEQQPGQPRPKPVKPQPVDLTAPHWWRLPAQVVRDVWDLTTEAFMPDDTATAELQLHLEGVLQHQPDPVQPAEFVAQFLAAFMRLQAAWAKRGHVMGITPWKAREHSGLLQKIMRGQLDPDAAPVPPAPRRGPQPPAPGGAGRIPVTGGRD